MSERIVRILFKTFLTECGIAEFWLIFVIAAGRSWKMVCTKYALSGAKMDVLKKKKAPKKETNAK